MKQEILAHIRLVWAIWRKDSKATRHILRKWHLNFRIKTLYAQKVWVIGVVYFPPYQSAAVDTLLFVSKRLNDPQILVGLTKYWEAAAEELWQSGNLEALSKRLTGTLRVYNATTYKIYGKMMAAQGEFTKAGLYLLLSGQYSADENEIVSRCKKRLSQMHPHQVLAEMPGPCRTRRARSNFSEKVIDDLSQLPLPDWYLGPKTK